MVEKHGDCPKCGGSWGWRGPVYDNYRAAMCALSGRGAGGARLLSFTCNRCGYVSAEQALDATPDPVTVKRGRPDMALGFCLGAMVGVALGLAIAALAVS